MSLYDLSISEKREYFQVLRKKAEELFSFCANGSGGLFSEVFYYLNSALESLEAMAPYKVGDRVELAKTPDLSNSPGWAGAKHFLVEGAKATVQVVDHSTHGFTVGLHFDDESWISDFGPDKGKIKPTPPEERHRYYFRTSSVRPIGAKAAATATSSIGAASIPKNELGETTRILRAMTVERDNERARADKAEAALAATRELYRDLAVELDATRRERNRFREIAVDMWKHVRPSIPDGHLAWVTHKVDAWIAEINR